MLLNPDACRTQQSVRQERIFSVQLIYRSQQFLHSELSVLVSIHKFVHYGPRQFGVSLQFLHKPFYRQTVNTKEISNISDIRSQYGNDNCKIKVKFTLQQATKAQRGSKCVALLFLQSQRWMGWVVNATPRPLYPREIPDTYCVGGWVGPRVGLDGCGISRLPPGFDPRPVQPVTSRYTDWAIPAPDPNMAMIFQ